MVGLWLCLPYVSLGVLLYYCHVFVILSFCFLASTERCNPALINLPNLHSDFRFQIEQKRLTRVTTDLMTPCKRREKDSIWELSVLPVTSYQLPGWMDCSRHVQIEIDPGDWASSYRFYHVVCDSISRTRQSPTNLGVQGRHPLLSK